MRVIPVALGALAAMVTTSASAEIMLATFRGTLDGHMIVNDDLRRVELDDVYFGGFLVFDSEAGLDISTPGNSTREGGAFAFGTSVITSNSFWVEGHELGFGLGGYYSKVSYDFANGVASFYAEDPSDSNILLRPTIPGLTPNLAQPYVTYSGTGAIAYEAGYAERGRTSAVFADITLNQVLIRPLAAGPPPTAVPEPSTWALMILGFTFAGAALRRRVRWARQSLLSHTACASMLALSLGAPASAGDLVLFEFSGVASAAGNSGNYALPGPGKYLFEFSSNSAGQMILLGGFEYRTLVLALPDGGPVLADQYEVFFGETLDGIYGSYLLDVPEAFYSLSAPLPAGNPYDLPAGTVLATEEKAVDPYFNWYFESLDVDGAPAPYSLTVTALGAVPEPETWALMILGFGGVGAGLRASRRAHA